MKHPILGITGHLNEDSYCRALFLQAKEVILSKQLPFLQINPWREDFHPALTLEELKRGFSFDPIVQDFSRKLERTPALVIAHPDWWGGPPAPLKGFLDRVLRPGIAYDFEGEEFEEKVKVGLLKNKKALVLITTDQKRPAGPSALESLWKETILGYCGMDQVEVMVHWETWSSEYGDRLEFLNNVKTTCQNFFKPTSKTHF